MFDPDISGIQNVNRGRASWKIVIESNQCAEYIERGVAKIEMKMKNVDAQSTQKRKWLVIFGAP
jgi:hypothetical protein